MCLKVPKNLVNGMIVSYTLYRKNSNETWKVLGEANCSFINKKKKIWWVLILKDHYSYFPDSFNAIHKSCPFSTPKLTKNRRPPITRIKKDINIP